MYTMSQIDHIKDMSSCGYRISEISKETGVNPKTIRKYLSQEVFSPVPPVVQEQPSKLDPFKPVIQEWLDEDKKHWRKQHHTARRVYKRLIEEQGYTGSYSVVQRYMKKCRSIRTEKANLELVWDPNPAQVDFGEADFYECGKLVRKKYLTVSFPYSNDGFSQVFGGETADQTRRLPNLQNIRRVQLPECQVSTGIQPGRTGGTGVCPRTEESCAVWTCWCGKDAHGDCSRGKGMQSWV